MASNVRSFKFGDGFHQENDDRTLEPGQPRAVENLVKLKNGALGMRLDYDALAVTTPSGNGCKLFDLHEFNGRLMGIGCRTSGTIPIDLYEFVNQPQFAWRPSDPNEFRRLSPVTVVRNMGRLPSQGFDALPSKVAAGAGLVCLVTVKAGASLLVHIFDPLTDSTELIQTVSTGTAPAIGEVVCISGVFFIAVVNNTSRVVELYRYNPASDVALVQLTDALATNGQIVLDIDMQATEAGTGFWLAVAKNGPTITLLLLSSSGAVTQTIVGPAVTISTTGFFAIFGQVARVHLLVAESSDKHVDLYTYALPAGTIENTSLDLAGGIATDVQPGMCVAGTGTNLCILIGEDVAASTQDNIVMLSLAPATHVVSTTRRWYDCTLNSKPAQLAGTELFAGVSPSNTPGPGGFAAPLYRIGANFLGVVGISQSTATEMIAAYTDRPFQGVTVNGAIGARQNKLSNIATDSSTAKSYWLRHTFDDDTRAQPVIGEFLAGSTARRQSTKAGDLEYFAAGAVQVYDGRQLVEAAFQETPRILSATGTTGGSKTPGAIKQLVPVWETYDAKDKKISSNVGDVFEITLAALQTAITVVASTPHSSRQNATSAPYGSTIRTVIYETLDTTGGDLTLHRGGSELNNISFGEPETILLTKSDTDLEDEEILYTQGARGALSGPLPFDAPEPASTLFASADTILSGGCPESARVQESRPQFIGEELNWSDEIGFQRDARGDVLSVSRLDERRIIHTATEIFQMDGPGLDDVGDGDLGPPRRLPSDVGIYGGRQGWQSMVEFAKGLLFQGKSDLLYLMPRGGNTPEAAGLSVRTLLASYPTITSAVYIQEAESVRFTCNNLANTDGIVIVYDSTRDEWFSEGPFGAPLTAGAQYQGRAILLRGGVAYRQKLVHPPATFVSNAWRSGVIHPAGLGQEGAVFDAQFFGTFRGNCSIRSVVRFDGGATFTGGKTETLASYSVTGFAVGDPVDFKWTTNQIKCESVMVDFEVTALAGAATAGVEYNFWIFTTRPMGKAALRGATQMA
jgi:hypothetical protein